jgi:hypothetical protein
MKPSLARYTFWLSFLGGIPFLLKITSLQSLNIAVIPALIGSLRSASRRMPLDCKLFIVAWAWHILYSLYYLNIDSVFSIAQFTSVFLVYLSLRISLYFPGHRGIIYFLFASLFLGFFQSLFEGISFRGVPMIESEPSRFARSLAVLILPFIVHYNKIKQDTHFILIVVGLILAFNRSASLGLIGLWMLIFLAEQFFSSLMPKIKSLCLPVNRVVFITSLFFVSFPLVLGFGFANTRLGNVISKVTTSIFSQSSETISVLYDITGRRLQTVVASFAQASFSLPHGVKGYEMFLNEQSFSQLGIFLSEYQSERLAARGNFESSSFVSSFVVQGGLVSFVLSFLFCLVILSTTIYFLKFFSCDQSFLRSSYFSSSIVALFQIVLYSNDSILQPWVMLALCLNLGTILKKKTSKPALKSEILY